MQSFSVDKRIVAEAMAIHLLPWQRTVYLYPGHNPWQRNGGANDMTAMMNLFVEANTNEELFNAIRLTMRKTGTALDRLMKAGFEFNGSNEVIRAGKLSSNDIEKLDAAVKGILYLHSVSPLWEGRKSTGSVKEKVQMIAEFNIALNETIAIAMAM